MSCLTRSPDLDSTNTHSDDCKRAGLETHPTKIDDYPTTATLPYCTVQYYILVVIWYSYSHKFYTLVIIRAIIYWHKYDYPNIEQNDKFPTTTIRPPIIRTRILRITSPHTYQQDYHLSIIYSICLSDTMQKSEHLQDQMSWLEREKKSSRQAKIAFVFSDEEVSCQFGTKRRREQGPSHVRP